jgi:hypothetical protein
LDIAFGQKLQDKVCFSSLDHIRTSEELGQEYGGSLADLTSIGQVIFANVYHSLDEKFLSILLAFLFGIYSFDIEWHQYYN